jgi:ABC-type Zn uptake system ZnuABC Zn-binding protein ZnuA
MNWRIAVIAFVAITVSGCSRMPDPWRDQPGHPRILVTFPPLYSMAKLIGGDEAAVKCLCVATGPHHYTYNPRDLGLMSGADAFFSVGLTLDDHFVNRMREADTRGKVQFEALGEAVKARKLCLEGDGHDHSAHEAGHDHAHDHSHGDEDPHVWLGIPQASVMAEQMALKLGEIQPEKASLYKERAQALIERLKELRREARLKLKDKNERRLISFHGSLAYFADSFGLQVAATMQLNPGSEPSAARLTQLARLCKEERVKVLAVEPQYSTGSSARLLAESLKRDGVEARMVEIDPMETADAAVLDAGWYERIMRNNIQALVDNLP